MVLHVLLNSLVDFLDTGDREEEERKQEDEDECNINDFCERDTE